MMLKQIWGYFKAWARGEDAELTVDKTWHISWWDMLFIVAVVAAVVWRVFY